MAVGHAVEGAAVDAQDLRGPRAVAGRGAVFVNFNYRVGIIGFLAHPELTKEQGGHSGNYGLMDQTLALRWIKDKKK